MRGQRNFLFRAEMASGDFETTVFLKSSGVTARAALIKLAAGLYEAALTTEENAIAKERRRARREGMPQGDAELNTWLMDYRIEPGAANGGVIFNVNGFIEQPTTGAANA
jgi:hypothetical protein